MELELLRSFVAILETGSFAKAGARRHLTQSTISMQMKRLAEQVGQPLFIARGRRRAAAPAAELLLGYAQRLLTLHDDALRALDDGAARELVRVGATQDFAETRLPNVLRAFNQAHPQIGVEVRVGGSPELSRLVSEGSLDVGVVFQPREAAQATLFARERGAWLAARGFTPPRAGEPWPLALFDAPCVFREAALRALDQAGLPWRVVYSTPSLSGLLAAVRAGLAVTLRLSRHSQKGLQSLSRVSSLPAAPSFQLALLSGERPTLGARALLATLRSDAVTWRRAATPSKATR